MKSFLKYTFLLLGCWILFSSFQKKQTPLLTTDTPITLIDSTIVKDTLLIKYVPVLPHSFQERDGIFLQSLRDLNLKDSLLPILKEYKTYFTQKSNGFKLYMDHLAEQGSNQVLYKIEQRFSVPNKDGLFYTIVILIFLYGFVNNVYPQYFPKLFNQFSQSSLRMIQFREQLLQNSLGSLIVNFCFVLSFSLLTTLFIFNNHLLALSFWEGFLYIILFFIGLYVGKYLCLKFAGYIFNTEELVSTYIFVVFMINKVLGVLLVPFVLVLAFAKPVFYPYAIMGAGVAAVLLLLYRYLFSLTSVRNKLHISSFHFFLYLCAFEILPLTLLYKFIVQYFGGTY